MDARGRVAERAVSLSVADVMTLDPVAIAPDATLREAVELLTRHGIGGLPVIASGKPVGTLSARDIIAFASTTPGVPTERADDDIWQEDAPPLLDDTDETSAAAYFAELWEDAGADVAERFRVTDCPEWDLLRTHTVEEAMTTVVVVVTPRTPLAAAAEDIRRAGVHRALVVTDDRVVGVVTTSDVSRAVAEHRII